MARDKHPLLEASESLRQYRESSEKKRLNKLQEAADEKARMEKHIFNAKEKRLRDKRVYSEFCNTLRTDLLNDALKGVYIGALMETKALTPDGIALAESLMENYVKESGGAKVVLANMSGKTYALDYIKAVVEGTYESIMEDTDEEDAKAPDEEEGETDPETPEVDEDKKEEMMNDLSADDDINKAVEVIAQRISDAEEEFIQKNKEDKETIQNIATKVADRINAVEDDAEAEAQDADSDEEAEEIKDDAENQIAQESRIARRQMNGVRGSRTRNVYEQVVNNLSASIMKDESLREQYTDEETGALDMGSVMEAATCIYGLLETVNTLQLERVDAQYIKEALETM